ncbi:alcohol dehydrogenase [Penicillium cosmopolitanum]|uniref:Alcohol dehydrogenase n=1 Tax=Penicillium cosmopolitanum TaxID=1131564 RepID=A0A9X0B3W7_9EURO|nr:alcohol dehydrogenase [Penicillium cosmopolitanum]KAJ5387229.1 alcohol dehydrogenase [Penicillium cosmopolitanum]
MAVPETQKALLVKEIGKPLVLVTDWPIPQPGPNQVQIKITVAGINPHDQRSRDLGIPIANDLPAVLTHDVVGKVTKLGEYVTGLTIGDRIVTMASLNPGSRQNGLQEYAVADIKMLAKIPESISDNEAATLPVNTIAPLAGLFGKLKLPAPWSSDIPKSQRDSTTVLIVGGGSSCGKFAVQLLRLARIGQIIVVGGDQAELEGLGATHVVDRHGSQDEVLGRIRALVGDELVYALDVINPPEGQFLAVNALSSYKKGSLARLLLGPFDESRVQGKKAGFEVINVYSAIGEEGVCEAFWAHLHEYLSTGDFKPLGYTVKNGLSAEIVNEVLDAYRDGKKVTKTHLLF